LFDGGRIVWLLDLHFRNADDEQRLLATIPVPQNSMNTSRKPSIFAQAHGIFKGVTLDYTPLRESRNFRLLLGGQTINLVGNQIAIVAIPYQVFLLTHSSLAVGALSLCQFVPLMCMYLIGGSLADMVDRRKLMLTTQILLACTAAALAVASIMGKPPVWYIFVVAMCAAGIQAVDNPTRRASIPRLVRREQIANALSLNQILSQTGQIAGPAVGGLLLAKAGFGAAYTVNVATFLVSILAVFLMTPLPPEEGGGLRNPLKSIGESFSFLKDKPILLSNFVVDMNGQIFGLPKALFPVLATSVFRNGAAGLGLLYAAPGVGSLVAALFTGWCGRVRRQGRTVVILVAIWGIAIALFGLSTHIFWLGLLMLAIAGGADTFSAVMRNTILQLVIPDRLRGRLSSVSMMTTTGGPRLGDAEAGAVATLTTPQFSVVSGGLLTLAGCVVVAFTIPVYWNWDAQRAIQYEAEPAPAT
jgi:MFS family permease